MELTLAERILLIEALRDFEASDEFIRLHGRPKEEAILDLRRKLQASLLKPMNP
jgi:hypothetical protein